MLISKDYRKNLTHFHTIDGVKAMILYGIYIFILFIQGLTYTTDLSVDILNKLQIAFPLFLLVIVIVFIVGSGEKLCTVGLRRINLIQSMLLGTVLAFCLITGMAVYFRMKENISVGIIYPMLSSLGIFGIAASQEEIIFRGYIQTRLTGIMKSPIVCSFCTALLFLVMYYPTRWAVGGFSLKVLDSYYVISLLILHFACDFVYKRTNCLWGAIALHFLYNTGQSMLII